MNRHTSLSVLSLAALFVIQPSKMNAQTNFFVVPEALSASFGATESFGFASYESFAQYVYAPSLFAKLPADVVAVTSVAFRVDERYTNLPPVDAGHIDISLNAYPGTMTDIASQRNGYTNPVVVFSSDHTLLSYTGTKYEFTLQFPFQKAFTYDRRIGPLVLGIHAVEGYDVDAETTPVSVKIINGKQVNVPQDGAVIYYQPDLTPQVSGMVVATEFIYAMRRAVFLSSTVDSNGFHFSFQVTDTNAIVSLQAAREIVGPFQSTTAGVTQLSSGKFTATVPLTNVTAFFRARID